MNLLEILTNTVKSADEFIKVNTFYFHNHICAKTGNNIKVNLNLKLSTDNNDKIMKFGMCNECKKVFYCYDFESKEF